MLFATFPLFGPAFQLRIERRCLLAQLATASVTDFPLNGLASSDSPPSRLCQFWHHPSSTSLQARRGLKSFASSTFVSSGSQDSVGVIFPPLRRAARQQKKHLAQKQNTLGKKKKTWHFDQQFDATPNHLHSRARWQDVRRCCRDTEHETKETNKERIITDPNRFALVSDAIVADSRLLLGGSETTLSPPSPSLQQSLRESAQFSITILRHLVGFRSAWCRSVSDQILNRYPPRVGGRVLRCQCSSRGAKGRHPSSGCFSICRR